MKVFLRQHLNIFPKLRRRLSSVKWTLLLAATAMFFLSAAAPNGCNFMISFGGNGPPTNVTGPSSSPVAGGGGSPTVGGGGSPTVGGGGSPTVGGGGSPTVGGGGSPTVGGGSPAAGGGSPAAGGGSPAAGGGSPAAGGGSPAAGGGSSPVVAPTQPASSGPPAPGGTVHMVSMAAVPPSPQHQDGFIFVDSVSKTETTTIKKGTTVTWTNPTKVGHTVTSDPTASDPVNFDSGLFAPGKTFSMTFTVVGTYKYICSVHEGQIGTIIVTA